MNFLFSSPTGTLMKKLIFNFSLTRMSILKHLKILNCL